MATVIPGQAAKNCSVCHAHGHNRLTCPKRIRREGRHCAECSGLPWRRPRGPRVLCACGEAYEAEPPITWEQRFEMPNHNRRELV